MCVISNCKLQLLFQHIVYNLQQFDTKSCIVDSIMETEYVVASEAAKEVVWLKKFLMELE